MTRFRALRVAAPLPILAIVVYAGAARAQDEENPAPAAIEDSTFQRHPHVPLGYMTSYDLNVSRGAWVQTLDYGVNTNRVAFHADGNLTTVQGKHGLETSGIDGTIFGGLDLRATNRWIWSLNGTFTGVSQGDNLSDTDVRQNRLQLRTQYSAKPQRQLQLMGLLFTELQQNQSLGSAQIPQVGTGYYTQTKRDSSYTSGRSDGFTGSATWTPQNYFRWQLTANANRISTTTNTVTRQFFVANPDSGTVDHVDITNQVPQKAPNGSQSVNSLITYSGIKKATATLNLKGQNGDQEYFALNKGAQEHIASQSRNAAFHIDQSPIIGGRLSLDVSAGRFQRLYRLQDNLNTLVFSQALSAAAAVMRTKTRASLNLDLSNVKNEKQLSQNGTTITRALGASGSRQVSQRLILDGLAGISLISRQYEVSAGDRDDQHANVNVGGGYLLARPCSTAVHFSINRGHTVALNAASSADNNVQTSYQMDALLHLQVTPSFLITQNYQLNATYFIYDYTISENRNTLSRIRRIDTFLVDSLFTGVYLGLIHNFFYQDRGAYSAQGLDGNRLYNIAAETYQQNLGLTLGVRPAGGVMLTATQSLSSTKDYFLSNNSNAVRNHWNLTLGATVNRELPAGIALNGSVQHISEYTEVPPDAPPGATPTDMADYWIAGATLNKEF